MDIENRASNVKDTVPSQNVENSRVGKIKKNSNAREVRVAYSPYAQLSSSQKNVEKKSLHRRSLREDFQVISKEAQENESQKKLDKKIENLALFLGKNDIRIQDLSVSEFFNLEVGQKVGRDFIVDIKDKKENVPIFGPQYIRTLEIEKRFLGFLSYDSHSYYHNQYANRVQEEDHSQEISKEEQEKESSKELSKEKDLNHAQ